MKSILLTLALLAAPSVALAHSGTVVKTVLGFWPLLLAALALIGGRLKSFFDSWRRRRE